jgi:septal ring factor EnvC (AmiA/AmiB activator)
MSRKNKINKEVVDVACEDINNSGANVTVSAVIQVVGGSYSTVGKMVKQWKEEKTKNDSIEAIEMPDGIDMAMKRATVEIWEAVTLQANEEIERNKKVTDSRLLDFKAELLEAMQEVNRLEVKLKEVRSDLSDCNNQLVKENSINEVLGARLHDRDAELVRLRDENKNLQAELLDIAKTSVKKKQETKK